MFNRKFIFKGSMFHCYVSLPECNFLDQLTLIHSPDILIILIIIIIIIFVAFAAHALTPPPKSPDKSESHTVRFASLGGSLSVPSQCDAGILWNSLRILTQRSSVYVTSTKGDSLIPTEHGTLFWAPVLDAFFNKAKSSRICVSLGVKTTKGFREFWVLKIEYTKI